MLHYMKINPEPFRKISEGLKTIELRLYDEKRQKIRVGDFIEFSKIGSDKNKITVRVTAFHCYENFNELYKSLSSEKLGYEEGEIADASDIERIYTKKQQSAFGVIGIEFRKTELQRFVDAQDNGYMHAATYEQAYEEIKNGSKATHWMWYVFPQIKGLAVSEVAKYFSVNNFDEAKDYLAHPVLYSRLINISEILLDFVADDPVEIFGYVDAKKLCSCMTLFREVSSDEIVFQQVIDKFFDGNVDEKTLEILK